jgi:nucleoside-diphosphate-sugar epimerase
MQRGRRDRLGGHALKLTVFGATGGVGRHVVTQALDRGDQVVA